MLCVCGYLAVKASAHNSVNAMVHGGEPILSVYYFFSLADTQVSLLVAYLVILSLSDSGMILSILRISLSTTLLSGQRLA